MYKKFISYFITPFYIFFFFGILVIFHIPLLLASYFNQRLFRFLLHLMNKAILFNIEVFAGATFITLRHSEIPKDRPLIIISNHQSMYDIPMMIWEFRDRMPRFIAKKELASFIPSISLSLRNMGSCIIDRKDPAQAIPEIKKLGTVIVKDNSSAFIFPEGTRSRDGNLKPFKSRGFLALLETAPNALIIPVSIKNGWKLLENNLMPIPWGETITLTIGKPIDPYNSKQHELSKLMEYTFVKIKEHT